jgi:hypothetical protein
MINTIRVGSVRLISAYGYFLEGADADFPLKFKDEDHAQSVPLNKKIGLTMSEVTLDGYFVVSDVAPYFTEVE